MGEEVDVYISMGAEAVGSAAKDAFSFRYLGFDASDDGSSEITCSLLVLLVYSWRNYVGWICFVCI